MADLGGTFDANAKENNQSSCLPAGEYDVVCVKSERKQTNAKDGEYLYCEFKVTRGEYQNRSIFCNFNLWLNPSKVDAINIAKGQFSQFCRAVGVLTPKDSSELENKPFIVKVNAKESDRGLQNNCVKFSPRQMQPAPAPQVEAAPQAAGVNPW